MYVSFFLGDSEANSAGHGWWRRRRYVSFRVSAKMRQSKIRSKNAAASADETSVGHFGRCIEVVGMELAELVTTDTVF